MRRRPILRASRAVLWGLLAAVLRFIPYLVPSCPPSFPSPFMSRSTPADDDAVGAQQQCRRAGRETLVRCPLSRPEHERNDDSNDNRADGPELSDGDLILNHLHRVTLHEGPVPPHRRDRRLQGGSPHPIAHRLRQAGRALRRARRLVRLGDPGLQHHDQHGAAHPQRAAVLRSVRARGHVGGDAPARRGAGERLCLERGHLREPVEGRPCHHGHELERPSLLWAPRSGTSVMMNRQPVRALRCAIYTRVSTEHGLEQEFNSLANQREASEAYVKSQAHEGWRCLPARYDDGGFSGGSMERPALQRLLGEIRSRRIDVIVVYKVDRLTRSLTDFAKLVELFDEHGVSFVSVTQAFNTTTSMGRLTLNVLLSFAQFEREVTGERIRDKIAV